MDMQPLGFSKRVETNRHASNDMDRPVGKRLKPVHKQETGWGPFDEDGFRLQE